MDLRKRNWLTWRALPILLIGLVAGSLLITPAVGHVTKKLSHLYKHLDKRYAKKADVFTKAEVFSKTESDQRFLQQTKVVVVQDSVGPTSNKITTVNCPAGHEATGGGYQFASDDLVPDVVWSEPLVNGDNMTAAGAGTFAASTGWRVNMDNTSGSTFTYAVGVICAPAA